MPSCISEASRRGVALPIAALLAVVLATCAFVAVPRAYADLSTGASDSFTEMAQVSTQEESEKESTNVFRMYNKYTGEHLYTTSFSESMFLITAGWKYEDVCWVSETEAAGDPVYRLYNQYSGDHLYTTSADEQKYLVSIGWTDEKIAFYTAKKDATGAAPVYRQFNPYEKVGTHNFTQDISEHNYLVGIGWKGEDVAWYSYKYTAGKTHSTDVSSEVYVLYNSHNGEHLYTVSQGEAAALVTAGWTFGTTGWKSLAKDATSPATAQGIYRLYNKSNGDHFYTISGTERDSLVSSGWTNEGIVFYGASASASGTGLKSVYRIDNPSASVGSHYYTTDTQEYERLSGLGWAKKGVVWKVL